MNGKHQASSQPKYVRNKKTGMFRAEEYEYNFLVPAVNGERNLLPIESETGKEKIIIYKDKDTRKIFCVTSGREPKEITEENIGSKIFENIQKKLRNQYVNKKKWNDGFKQAIFGILSDIQITKENKDNKIDPHQRKKIMQVQNTSEQEAKLTEKLNSTKISRISPWGILLRLLSLDGSAASQPKRFDNAQDTILGETQGLLAELQTRRKSNQISIDDYNFLSIPMIKAYIEAKENNGCMISFETENSGGSQYSPQVKGCAAHKINQDGSVTAVSANKAEVCITKVNPKGALPLNVTSKQPNTACDLLRTKKEEKEKRQVSYFATQPDYKREPAKEPIKGWFEQLKQFFTDNPLLYTISRFFLPSYVSAPIGTLMTGAKVVELSENFYPKPSNVEDSDFCTVKFNNGQQSTNCSSALNAGDGKIVTHVNQKLEVCSASVKANVENLYKYTRVKCDVDLISEGEYKIHVPNNKDSGKNETLKSKVVDFNNPNPVITGATSQRTEKPIKQSVKNEL